MADFFDSNSASQSTNQQQVGVQGGSNGSQQNTLGAGAIAGASNLGGSSNTTLGYYNNYNGAKVSITNTDSGAIAGALGLAEDAITGAQRNTSEALHVVSASESAFVPAGSANYGADGSAAQMSTPYDTLYHPGGSHLVTIGLILGGLVLFALFLRR